MELLPVVRYLLIFLTRMYQPYIEQKILCTGYFLSQKFKGMCLCVDMSLILSGIMATIFWVPSKVLWHRTHSSYRVLEWSPREREESHLTCDTKIQEECLVPLQWTFDLHRIMKGDKWEYICWLTKEYVCWYCIAILQKSAKIWMRNLHFPHFTIKFPVKCFCRHTLRASLHSSSISTKPVFSDVVTCRFYYIFL